VLSADAYNQLFTMHATTMVFLVVMPLARRS
jgi:cytochrome c oxidase subunit 1